ncbi:MULTISPECIES: Wzz/FepE/Etk N-terminal domain-containing protein [unclassified Thioalkalivibrio]|uniref:Wzz/FepE/Etk N-terminal domain-containing protein n=1 Tax=unclassified Thioalkalivibrio TaxID=2621013 RepID=UPI00037BB0CA|nr:MULTISPECIES: Wzz/FepE/Etk N-terminal domain-containing protein [unclassified Thioalkalivibrio]
MTDSAGPQARPYDDEISLYDLYDVVMRRLLLILGVAVLTVVLGAVYAFMQPVEYEYRSGVDLPGVYSELANEASPGTVDVVSRGKVIERLEDVLIPQQRAALDHGQQGAPAVRVTAEGSEYSLTLTSKSTRDRANQVADLHRQVVAALSEWLGVRFDESLAASLRPHYSRMELLDEQIAILQDDLDELRERLDEREDVAGLIMAQRVSDIRRELAELRKQRVDARSKAETIQAMSREMEETFVARESDSPVGPGRSLIVALSVVLGGMLGLFAAFFWEFVSNARSRRPEPN